MATFGKLLFDLFWLLFVIAAMIGAYFEVKANQRKLAVVWVGYGISIAIAYVLLTMWKPEMSLLPQVIDYGPIWRWGRGLLKPVSAET